MRETGDKGKKGEKGERKEKSGRRLPPLLYDVANKAKDQDFFCKK